MIKDYKTKIKRMKNRTSLTEKQEEKLIEVMTSYDKETYQYYIDVATVLFGDISEGGLTLEDISIVLDITRERVRQIEKDAIRKLKHPRKIQKLREYLNL